MSSSPSRKKRQQRTTRSTLPWSSQAGLGNWPGLVIFMRWIREIASWLYKPKLNKDGGAIEIRNTISGWTRSQLEEQIVELVHEGPRAVGVDWFWRYYIAAKEVSRVRDAMKLSGDTDRSINNKLHMADLEKKVKTLKRQVADMREALEHKNKSLAGLKYVWCSGGCPGGVTDADEITEEVVQLAERNTKRLRQWWQSRQFRQQKGR